ncbi:MAG: hypothetical protein H0V84_04935 [Actinobacteria bacterium]|nr:hypothetical protein [Actinomycetota bacterium]
MHVPRHARSLVELSDDELRLVVSAWRARRAALPDGYLYVFVNEGAGAGASLQHSHSQLAWLPAPPPGVVAAGREQAAAGRSRRDLLVASETGIELACPPTGWAPYQLVSAPDTASGGGAFAAGAPLESAFRLAVRGLRLVHSVVGACAANIWLHDGPHWRLELVPRLGVLAGLELGAGVYVNPVAPEEAARALRCAGA